VADAAQCPTYLYGIPALTGVAIPLDVVRRVAEHPYFGGLKFSACDVPQLVAYAQAGARVFIGCDAQITAAVRAGAAGTVSGTGACLPEPYARLFARLRHGADAADAQAWVTRFDALFAPFPPIAAYKAVLRRRGVIASDAVRRPLRPLTPGEAARLDAALAEVAL
jgi:4-hydroxy-tetrahydrodipicolinate synthase